jgi:hypothetical protein
LGTTVTNQNFIQDYIKWRLNSGDICYHSVQNLLFSRLLCKDLKNRIYKATVLPAVLYGCETWCLTLREEHRTRVFENRVLRRIFGPKRDEVTEGWGKRHNGQLHNLHCSSRRMRWAGHVARMGRKRNTCRTLVGPLEENRPVGRPSRTRADNIKMDVKGLGWFSMEWIYLAQCRAFVNMVMNFHFPYNVWQLLSA